jgi:hypothetical protein
MHILSKDTRKNVENNSLGTARYSLILYLLVVYYKLSIAGLFLMLTCTNIPSCPKLGHYECFCGSEC